MSKKKCISWYLGNNVATTLQRKTALSHEQMHPIVLWKIDVLLLFKTKRAVVQ